MNDCGKKMESSGPRHAAHAAPSGKLARPNSSGSSSSVAKRSAGSPAHVRSASQRQNPSQSSVSGASIGNASKRNAATSYQEANSPQGKTARRQTGQQVPPFASGASAYPRNENVQHQMQNQTYRPGGQPVYQPGLGSAPYAPAKTISMPPLSRSSAKKAPLQGGVSPQIPPTKGKKGKGKRVWKVLFTISLIVFLVSSVLLGSIIYSYWKGQQSYKGIAETALDTALTEDVDLAAARIDWDALKAINPDVVAWIYMPGTPINYPVVHTDNDETYLSKQFGGSEDGWAKFGCIFLAADNSPDFTDQNSIIYGHHLNDGSMFAAISEFGDENEFNSHRTWYLFTPTKNYRMSSLFLVHCAADDRLAQTAFASDDEFQSYLKDKQDRAVASASDVGDLSEIDQVFTLITCDNYTVTSGRFVLYSRIADMVDRTSQESTDRSSEETKEASADTLEG